MAKPIARISWCWCVIEPTTVRCYPAEQPEKCQRRSDDNDRKRRPCGVRFGEDRHMALHVSVMPGGS